MNEFLQRLKQRKLVQWALAYFAAAFALLQGIDIVAAKFGWPDSVERILIIASCVGFFVTLVLAWYHGERGAQKISGAELLIIGLVLAVGGGLLWRFGSIKEVSADKPASVPNEPKTVSVLAIPAKSIAVLPFENLSADKDNAFFASGIQDMILTKLAGIKDLKVISRTSTEKYASHPENLKDIAQELGVAKILEGSVQKAGNAVLINVQMIDARTDAHLWAEAYNRTLENIFGVEGEVAQNIAESLHAALSGTERATLAQKPTENVAALEAYLKGVSLASGVTYTESPEAVVTALQEAVRLDPGFTLAWTKLASAQLSMFWWAYDASPGRLEAAKEALDKAEALAPDLPEVEMTRAEYLYHGLYDFTQALAAIRQVQAKLPNDARVWYLTALLERRTGDFGAAIKHFARARELDPNSIEVAGDADGTLIFLGHYDAARRALDRDLARGSGTSLFYELKLILEWNTGGLAAADQWLAQLHGDGADIVAMRAWQALYQRDFKKASELFAHAAATGSNYHSQLVFDGYVPNEIGWCLQQALSETRGGSPANAKELYLRAQAMARAHLVTKSVSRNVEAGWHTALGMANAGLGQAEQAVVEAKTATELVPEKADAFEGPDWQGYLAQVYAMNGDADHALPLIKRLHSTVSSTVTSFLLTFDPVWDPIRNDPRFKTLLAKHAVGEKSAAP